MSLILPRRNFLAGIASVLAAPAIVRVENIMPVRAIPLSTYTFSGQTIGKTVARYTIFVGDQIRIKTFNADEWLFTVTPPPEQTHSD